MIPEGCQVSQETRPEAAQLAAPFWRLVLKHGNAIAPFNESGSGPAFYCVHPISGDVTSFYDLAKSLGAEQRFYGIQVPKSKMNPAFAVSIEAVARHHVEKLIAFQPQGAIVLGGWSAGAIVALEMAQQLRALGRDVPLLIALDGAPCNTGAGINRWSLVYSWKLICNLPGWIYYELMETGSVRAFVRQLVNKLTFRTRMALPAFQNEQTLDGGAVQRLTETPGWLSEQMSFIRAMYDAMRTYVPKPYPGRVIVYEARTQPLDHLLEVGSAWMRIAESVEVVRLNGNHGIIFREPNVGILTKHLRMRLAELRQSMDASCERSESAALVDRPAISDPAT